MDQKKDTSSDTLIMSIIRHIEANYKHRDLCTDTLADVFKISAPYLGKIFREKTARSISEHITDTRMEKAKELLEHSSHTVDEIIDRVGWENKKYFYTTLTSHTLYPAWHKASIHETRTIGYFQRAFEDPD